MSQLEGKPLEWIQRFFAKVIKCGPIPRHVALIMDGNRRYAVKRNIEKRAGHLEGFSKLLDVMAWCAELGIEEITAYAFSTENFKRSPEEVAGIMHIFESKLKAFLDNKHILHKRGIRMRVIGKVTLLTTDIQALISRLTEETKTNSLQFFCNVAVAYSAREEITQAISRVVCTLPPGESWKRHVSEHRISSCLYTSPSPEPDLVIRTSGEVRLSDFLLWQTTQSRIYFVKQHWPELNFWTMMNIIIDYQRSF